MDGYLMRLVNPNIAPARVQPVIRSASPIAQEDQRVGMSGFDTISMQASSLPDEPAIGAMG